MIASPGGGKAGWSGNGLDTCWILSRLIRRFCDWSSVSTFGLVRVIYTLKPDRILCLRDRKVITVWGENYLPKYQILDEINYHKKKNTKLIDQVFAKSVFIRLNK